MLCALFPPTRLPFSFITADVARATCNCLLAQADEAIKADVSHSVAEMMILEEFGRCLRHVIDSASRSKGKNDVHCRDSDI